MHVVPYSILLLLGCGGAVAIPMNNNNGWQHEIDRNSSLKSPRSGSVQGPYHSPHRTGQSEYRASPPYFGFDGNFSYQDSIWNGHHQFGHHEGSDAYTIPPGSEDFTKDGIEDLFSMLPSLLQDQDHIQNIGDIAGQSSHHEQFQQSQQSQHYASGAAISDNIPSSHLPAQFAEVPSYPMTPLLTNTDGPEFVDGNVARGQSTSSTSYNLQGHPLFDHISMFLSNQSEKNHRLEAGSLLGTAEKPTKSRKKPPANRMQDKKGRPKKHFEVDSTVVRDPDPIMKEGVRFYTPWKEGLRTSEVETVLETIIGLSNLTREYIYLLLRTETIIKEEKLGKRLLKYIRQGRQNEILPLLQKKCNVAFGSRRGLS